MPVITLNEDHIQDWAPFHLFQQLAGDYRFQHFEGWTLEPKADLKVGVDALKGELIAMNTTERGTSSALVRMPHGTLIALRWYRSANMLYLNLASNNYEEIQKFAAVVKEVLPRISAKKDTKPRIYVNFTTVKGAHTRIIDAAAWPDVEDNYPASVQEQLGVFMDPNFRPSSSGQLMLWHGLPGTGKTWAIRALGYQWRKWAAMVYVVDPESFFGDGVYMMNVLTGDHSGPPVYAADDGEEEDPERVDRRERWRLIVAEDTGELLSADAKARTGQGLSRLLNIVDGMIGQGLRVMVLITTNEKLGALHPAVTRPGRAASIIEFGAFSAEEANKWLRAHGREERKSQKPITLAELYNAKEKAPERKVGFAA